MGGRVENSKILVMSESFWSSALIQEPTQSDLRTKDAPSFRSPGSGTNVLVHVTRPMYIFYYLTPFYFLVFSHHFIVQYSRIRYWISTLLISQLILTEANIFQVTISFCLFNCSSFLNDLPPLLPAFYNPFPQNWQSKDHALSPLKILQWLPWCLDFNSQWKSIAQRTLIICPSPFFPHIIQLSISLKPNWSFLICLVMPCSFTL